jgi:hypothetical protein
VPMSAVASLDMLFSTKQAPCRVSFTTTARFHAIGVGAVAPPSDKVRTALARHGGHGETNAQSWPPRRAEQANAAPLSSHRWHSPRTADSRRESQKHARLRPTCSAL